MEDRSSSIMKPISLTAFGLVFLALFSACQSNTPHASRSKVPPPAPPPVQVAPSFVSEADTLPPIVDTGFPADAEAKQEEVIPESNLVSISTKFGVIVLELDPGAAPKTVENFKKLVAENFYNGTTFHRVIPGFMIQGGDPNSKDANRALHGQGGPGYTVPAEIGLKHVRGSVATARLGDSDNPKRESSGSQFFICVADAAYLDGQYTVFAKVVSGMDVADKIVALPRDAADNPVEPVPMKIQFKETGN